MLSGQEILRQLELGTIVIDPFDPKLLGPNSYDVTLGPYIGRYKSPVLNCKHKHDIDLILIPETGFILTPGIGYLGHTHEIVGTRHTKKRWYKPQTWRKRNLVSCLEGKSGLGRLFLSIHETAGFGDISFVGEWTLEMTVTHPLVVYPGQRIGQVYFEEIVGDVMPYAGRYNGQYGPTASKFYTSFGSQAVP